MASLMSGGARVDIFQTKSVVVFNQDDMRMSADQYLRRILKKPFANASRISARATRDVSHPDIDAFANEPFILREFLTDLGIINIAVHAAEWLKGSLISGRFRWSQNHPRARSRRSPDTIRKSEGPGNRVYRK